MAEWLRRWTANPLGSPRVGSNPILVDYMFLHTDWGRITQMKSEKKSKYRNTERRVLMIHSLSVAFRPAREYFSFRERIPIAGEGWQNQY